MKNSMVVYVEGDSYECIQFNGGIDIYDIFAKKYIGMAELDLPDVEDEDAVNVFQKEIQQWLDENYL